MPLFIMRWREEAIDRCCASPLTCSRRPYKRAFVKEMPYVTHLGQPIGRRVAIFGAGGKSSLARAIAAKYGLRHIELDEINQLPGWKRRPAHEIRAMLSHAMAQSPEGWVTDHSSPEASDLIFENADTLIVLDLPFPLVLWRRVRRSLTRAWRGSVVCGGNVETFRHHLLSRESAIWEAWTKRKKFGTYAERIVAKSKRDLPCYRLTSDDELRRFYEEQGLRFQAVE